MKEHHEPYETATKPPMPVIRAFSVASVGGRWKSITTVLIDSGADISALPEAIVLRAVRHAKSRKIKIKDVSGTTHHVDAVELEYGFGQHASQGRAFFASIGSEALIGRDVINRYKVVFDGASFDSDDGPSCRFMWPE